MFLQFIFSVFTQNSRLDIVCLCPPPAQPLCEKCFSLFLRPLLTFHTFCTMFRFGWNMSDCQREAGLFTCQREAGMFTCQREVEMFTCQRGHLLYARKKKTGFTCPRYILIISTIIFFQSDFCVFTTPSTKSIRIMRSENQPILRPTFRKIAAVLFGEISPGSY